MEKMEQDEKWYVMYTQSRQEKILAEELEHAGYTVYLPLVKKVRQWSDRKKTIEVPLFNSYVFIKGVHEKMEFKSYRSFVSFIQYNGKPAIVRQHEINTLKSVIKHGYDITESGDMSSFSEGNKVLVTGGPLKGMTGELVSVSNQEWFIMKLENMANCLQIKIPSRSLKRI